jgi:hypothetical protein
MRTTSKLNPQYPVTPWREASWNIPVERPGTQERKDPYRPNQAYETVTIVELDPKESAPVLKEYLKQFPYVKSYFDVTPESPLYAFEAEAPRHPVFRIIGPSTTKA